MIRLTRRKAATFPTLIVFACPSISTTSFTPSPTPGSQPPPRASPEATPVRTMFAAASRLTEASALFTACRNISTPVGMLFPETILNRGVKASLGGALSGAAVWSDLLDREVELAFFLPRSVKELPSRPIEKVRLCGVVARGEGARLSPVIGCGVVLSSRIGEGVGDGIAGDVEGKKIGGEGGWRSLRGNRSTRVLWI